MLPLITLEEHFLSPTVRAASQHGDPRERFPEPLLQKLLSLSDERIQDMDKGNVSLQIISHSFTSGSRSPEVCRKVNDELMSAIQANKTRYAGFAMLPMADAPAAAAELSRCVKELGFVGALVDNHVNGRFYDDEAFWPIFAQAQYLDVPIYLHPTIPSDEMAMHYEGNYPPEVAKAMSAQGWGWHSETGFHILRLFVSGFFDRFPRIKIIIGHMGEMLPYMLDRIITFTTKWAGWGRRERGLQQVWDENIWITTSGMFSLAPLACLVRATKMDRILYSVDYPFSTNERGSQFIEEISKSGLVTEEELELIAYRNAERLLRVHVQ